jgi:mRNA interferase HigB
MRSRIGYNILMNVVSRQTLIAFWTKHPQAKGPLNQWFSAARRAEWKTTQDIRADYNSADFLADNRVVFDLGGNKYRVVVRVSYTFKQVLIKFVGTHAEYDKIDATKV